MTNGIRILYVSYYPTGRFGGCLLDITLIHLDQRSRNMPSSVPVSSCWPLAGFSRGGGAFFATVTHVIPDGA